MPIHPAHLVLVGDSVGDAVIWGDASPAPKILVNAKNRVAHLQGTSVDKRTLAAFTDLTRFLFVH